MGMKLDEFMDLVIKQVEKNENSDDIFKDINIDDYIDKDKFEKLLKDIEKKSNKN